MDPKPDTDRYNSNASLRLAEIAAHTSGSPLHWLDEHKVSELARLRKELSAGRYIPAIGLLDNPGRKAGLLELLLQYVPILLWPRVSRLTSEHRERVDACWQLLPEGFITAYREHWSDNGTDLVADIRAIWDDEDWLSFCSGFQVQSTTESRSA